MARGISEGREPFSYVLECDRGLPEDEQTIWWIVPYGALDTFKLEKRFARSEMAARGGSVKIDTKLRESATTETFLEFMDHIDNYFFEDSKKGVNIASHETEEKKHVLRTMKPEWLTELLEVASGRADIELASKKPSNSLHTSKSGSTTITK